MRTDPPTARAVLVGAYTEVEMSNCHPKAFADAYVSQYLAPVSNHVVGLHRRMPGLTRRPFIYADPYYEDRASCLSPDAYAQFWRGAFLAAPGFSLIAPQVGYYPIVTLEKQLLNMIEHLL